MKWGRELTYGMSVCDLVGHSLIIPKESIQYSQILGFFLSTAIGCAKSGGKYSLHPL